MESDFFPKFDYKSITTSMRFLFSFLWENLASRLKIERDNSPTTVLCIHCFY